ncbi:EAL domain-containing protein [Euzebya pacifica]|uniref:EAL domain-containing protein n=1 Tax=Euzebya pacifica TaxID=1608957 RepID=UPI000DF789C8|nr:EAL domain-containing protein [Euzebya pacifica]
MQRDPQILDGVPAALLRLTETGVVVYANRAAGRFLRCAPALLVGRHYADLVEDRQRAKELLATRDVGTVERRLIQRFCLDDGDANWGIAMFGGVEADHTRWVRLEPMIQDTSETMAPVIALVEALVGADRTWLLHDKGAHVEVVSTTIVDDTPQPVQFRIDHDRHPALHDILEEGRSIRWRSLEGLADIYPGWEMSELEGLESGMVVPLLEDGAVLGAVCWGWAIPGPPPVDDQQLLSGAERVAAAVRSREQHRLVVSAQQEATALAMRFQTVVEELEEGVVLWHGEQDLTPLAINPATERLLGIDQMAQLDDVLLRGADGDELGPGFLRRHARTAMDSGAAEVRLVQLADGAEVRWLTLRSRPPMRDADLAAVSILVDVTDRHLAEARLRHQMLHDALTGLANRTLLMDRLAQELQRARRHGGQVAVFFLDLDDFKRVNDTLGHDVGDALLVHVAGLLRSAVRPDDTVARLGGDEFVLVCDIESSENAWDIAKRIHATSQTGMEVGDGARLRPAFSIGMVLADPETVDPVALLRDADSAMYAAKERGKGRTELFGPEHRRTAAARRTLQAGLRDGVEAGEVVPWFQPVVDLRTGRVVAAEALARWQRADDVLGPDRFLSLAQDAGFMAELGDTLLRRAADSSSRHRGATELDLHLNCTPAELVDGRYARSLRSLHEQAVLDPHRLVLDLTEDVLLTGAGDIKAQIAELRAMGVRVSLDDFGTGLSSLVHLRRFGVDIVKIDRSLVAGLPHDNDSAALVAGIFGMAGALGLKTVAEGVETVEQRDWLLERGCDFAQGHLFGSASPTLPS